MRPYAFRFACVSVLGGMAGCANILGIDDGTPRPDASLDVTSPTPDAGRDTGAGDTGPDVATSPLRCGSTTCNAALAEACCRDDDGGYACLPVDAGASCKGLLIPCDRPEQCPTTEAGAEQCCGKYTVGEGGVMTTTSVACRATCVGSQDEFVLCGDNSTAECPPPDASCGASALLPMFPVCK